jgi:hypothetical protein
VTGRVDGVLVAAAAERGVGLALTYAISRTSVPAWWLLPVLLVLLLPASLWLGVRKR